MYRSRFSLFLLLVGLAAGGYFFFKNYRIEGLEHLKVVPRTVSAGGGDNFGGPPVRSTGTIRVASFNIQVFGSAKLNKPEVVEVLAEVIRRFDVVAIQEIRAQDESLLPRFVDIINSKGRHYDYVIGPRLGRTNSKEQYAFIFDAAAVEVDRNASYTVQDPGDRLHREPLVGWFRARGPPPDQAFTFSLINIHTDPDETQQELDALDDAFRAVRDDGRGEDDIILLGDLNVDEQKLGELGSIPGIMWLVSGVPTNTRGNKTYDNILLNRLATTEFTGRAGVFDLVREFNLTLEQALEISDHLPIWAEFNTYEGGQAGRVAAQPSGAPR